MTSTRAPEGAPLAREGRKLPSDRLDLKHDVLDFWTVRLPPNHAALLRRIVEQTALYGPSDWQPERQLDLKFLLTGRDPKGKQLFAPLNLPHRTAERARADLKHVGLITVKKVLIPRVGYRSIYGVNVPLIRSRSEDVIAALSQPAALTANVAGTLPPTWREADRQNGGINSLSETPGTELPIATCPDLRASGAPDRDCSDLQASPVSGEPSVSAPTLTEQDQKFERGAQNNTAAAEVSLSAIVAAEVAWNGPLSGNDLEIVTGLARRERIGESGLTVNELAQALSIPPGLVSYIVEGIKHQWPDLLSRQRHGVVRIDLAHFLAGPNQSSEPETIEEEVSGRWLFGVVGGERCYSQEEWEAETAARLELRDAERAEANKLLASAVAAADADTAYALVHEGMSLLRASVHDFDDEDPDDAWVEDRAAHFMTECNLWHRPRRAA